MYCDKTFGRDEIYVSKNSDQEKKITPLFLCASPLIAYLQLHYTFT